MSSQLRSLVLVLALLAGVNPAGAQGTRFFRITGPADATILAFQPDGTLVWSNAQPSTNYIVQTSPVLPGGTNWVDYVQLSTTNSVSTNQIVDFNPPAGMAFIPAGPFTMGDALDGGTNEGGGPDRLPVRTMVSAFYMDVNLVTYSQWQSVYSWATNSGYSFDNGGYFYSGAVLKYPKSSINWYDAVKWCNARSEMEGLTPAYYTDATQATVYRTGDLNLTNDGVNWTASGYRLPTEAEWEKAARGGLNGKRFPWGDTISESQASYNGDTHSYSYDLGPNGFHNGQTGPSPAGSFAPNGYGLYDMAGNLDEVCWDWYALRYAGGIDPHGPASGNMRITRGGNWSDPAPAERCADRYYFSAADTFSNIAFRCVRAR